MGSYEGIDCENEEAKPQVGSQHKTNNSKKNSPYFLHLEHFVRMNITILNVELLFDFSLESFNVNFVYNQAWGQHQYFY
jgi:hypothetical protein